MNLSTIQQIQIIVGVKPDDRLGPITAKAILEKLKLQEKAILVLQQTITDLQTQKIKDSPSAGLIEEDGLNK